MTHDWVGNALALNVRTVPSAKTVRWTIMGRTKWVSFRNVARFPLSHGFAVDRESCHGALQEDRKEDKQGSGFFNL